MKKSPVLKILCICAAVFFLLAAGGGTYLFHLALSRKAPYNPADIPETEKIAAAGRAQGDSWMRDASFERLSLTAADGTPLAGYYLAAQRGQQKKTARVAVLVHGYGTNAGLMANYAQFYREDGFDVFLPDNRAHGESGGKWIGMGRLDKDDLAAWIDFLVQKSGSASEIVLHGISMGASAVLMLNTRGLASQVKCVVADCGYTSAWDEFRHQLKAMFGLPSFPLLYIASIEAKLIAGYSFTDASALEAVKAARAPVFFIHGGADTFVPTHMARELYEAAPPEKHLWLVPGAEHAMAYYANPREYIRRVREFYSRYISG